MFKVAYTSIKTLDKLKKIFCFSGYFQTFHARFEMILFSVGHFRPPTPLDTRFVKVTENGSVDLPLRREKSSPFPDRKDALSRSTVWVKEDHACNGIKGVKYFFLFQNNSANVCRYPHNIFNKVCMVTNSHI